MVAGQFQPAARPCPANGLLNASNTSRSDVILTAPSWDEDTPETVIKRKLDRLPGEVVDDGQAFDSSSIDQRFASPISESATLGRQLNEPGPQSGRIGPIAEPLVQDGARDPHRTAGAALRERRPDLRCLHCLSSVLWGQRFRPSAALSALPSRMVAASSILGKVVEVSIQPATRG